MSNIDSGDIGELLGEEFVDALTQEINRPWEIEQAMETDWTHREMNPPDSLDGTNWTRTLRLSTRSLFRLIVQAAEEEYNTHSPSHTVKKLCRFGLSEILLENAEQMNKIKKYDEVSVSLGLYQNHDQEQYSILQEKIDLSIEDGRKIGDRPNYGVIWHQKRAIDSISDLLGIDQSDVLRWAVYLAGKELCEIGVFPDPVLQRIEKVLSQIYAFLDKTEARYERGVRSMLVDVLGSESSPQVVEMCRQEHPWVLDEYDDIVNALTSNSTEEDQFLSDFEV